MTQIQQRAPAVRRQFPLVCFHDPRLQRAAPPDQVREVGARPIDRPRLQPRKERRVPQQAILHDLRHSRRKFARRQRGQQPRVDVHRPRLVEGAHEVFPGRHVDARLPADGAVDHRQQSRRHLQEIHPAQPRGRREPREIADHAAAARHHHPAAVQSLRRQKPQHPLEPGQRFRPLARRQRQHRRRPEHLRQKGPLRRPHRLVGHHRHPPARSRQLRHLRPQPRGQPLPEVDRVRACAQLDREGSDHEAD
jgi:hypothetical protein